MDRRVGAAIAALVVVALALVAWETFDDPGHRPPRAPTARQVALADGFHVAAGSRLVGAVFPRPPGVLPDDPGGWSALLDVDGDAVTVFDAYADQARRLGYRQTPAGPSPCSVSDPHPGATATTTLVPGPIPGPVEQVFCDGGYYRDDGATMNVELRVCSTCDVPVSAARITTYAGTTPSSAALVAITVAPRSPSLALTESQHRRAWEERLARAQPESRPLGPGVSFGECDGDDHAVFEVVGDAPQVFDAYVRAQPPEELGTRVHAHIGGDDVTAWGSPQGRTITLLRSTRLRRPLIAIDVCYISPG